MAKRLEMLDKPNGVMEQPEADPLIQARQQIESANQQRIAAATDEITAVLQKYNVTLQTRQMLIDGMPAGPIQIAIVPKP